LQQAGSLRIEHAPRDIDVGDGIAIEQKIASLKVVKEGKQRHKDSDPGDAGRATVGNGGSLRSHFALAAGLVMATYSSAQEPAPKQAAEKLIARCPAPKGAYDFEELAVSLKRYPDTNLSFSADCKSALTTRHLRYA
jgi:hypothetical protein